MADKQEKPKFVIVGVLQGKERRGTDNPNYWTLKILEKGKPKDAYPKKVSFNATIPESWEDPKGPSKPNPDWQIVKEAEDNLQLIKVSGYKTAGTHNGAPVTYWNGTKCEWAQEGDETQLDIQPEGGEQAPAQQQEQAPPPQEQAPPQQQQSGPQAQPAPQQQELGTATYQVGMSRQDRDFEDAKWAVGLVVANIDKFPEAPKVDSNAGDEERAAQRGERTEWIVASSKGLLRLAKRVSVREGDGA